jgi:hypothetical protein
MDAAACAVLPDRLAKITRFRLVMPIAYTVKSVEKTNKQVMIDVEVYK